MYALEGWNKSYLNFYVDGATSSNLLSEKIVFPFQGWHSLLILKANHAHEEIAKKDYWIMSMFCIVSVAKCPDPPEVENGDVFVLSNSTEIGAIVEYACTSRKYKLVGAKQLKCLPGGVYDNSPPVCKGILLSIFCFYRWRSCMWIYPAEKSLPCFYFHYPTVLL